MSSKIIVHKFETGNNDYKFLNISITDDPDNNSSKIRFGQWSDGIAPHSKKEALSRLVVKIVTGKINSFDLDCCAKEIQDIDNFASSNSEVSNCTYNQTDFLNNYSRISSYVENKDKEENKIEFITLKKQNLHNVFYNVKNSDPKGNCYEIGNTDSPLESSLERVKENNARIMENICMLNRTLSYTKSKENLDVAFSKSLRSHPCNTCGKCFVYETGLKRHYSMRHAINEIQARWQIVWICAECYQVWPKRDLAMEHSRQCCKTDNDDCVREIKISSLLQCEFCEKVYTNIPRLLRHSKMHGTLNNYECNACNKSFASYKIAEEHWFSCPWLKMYYSFSLQKLLLCNVCDRKFRNYEQLYGHRYKFDHFITKMHYDQSSISQGILVYQCETCAKWFGTTPLLQVHRLQCHPIYDMGMQKQAVTTFNEHNNNCYINSMVNEYTIAMQQNDST